MTGLNIRDTQCGFKGFRHRAANEIFGRQRIDGFSFDVEVLLLAQAMGFLDGRDAGSLDEFADLQSARLARQRGNAFRSLPDPPPREEDPL